VTSQTTKQAKKRERKTVRILIVKLLVRFGSHLRASQKSSSATGSSKFPEILRRRREEEGSQDTARSRDSII